METMKSAGIYNARPKSRRIGKMWPETRKLIQQFYMPFNEALAKMFNDNSFLWWWFLYFRLWTFYFWQFHSRRSEENQDNKHLPSFSVSPGVSTPKRVAAQKYWIAQSEGLWGRSEASRQRTPQIHLDTCNHFMQAALWKMHKNETRGPVHDL